MGFSESLCSHCPLLVINVYFWFSSYYSLSGLGFKILWVCFKFIIFGSVGHICRFSASLPCYLLFIVFFSSVNIYLLLFFTSIFSYVLLSVVQKKKKKRGSVSVVSSAKSHFPWRTWGIIILADFFFFWAKYVCFVVHISESLLCCAI